MKKGSCVIIGIVIVIAIFMAGCTQPTPTTPVTTPTTTVPTTVPTTTTVTSAPVANITQTTTSVPTANQTPTSQEQPNSIAFTSVPAIGSNEYLKGTAKVLDPSKYKVVVYIFVSGWWGPKPQWEKPYTDINTDGTWSTNIVSGGSDTQASKIAAFLVPANYKPPNMTGGQELPSDLEQYVNIKVNR